MRSETFDMSYDLDVVLDEIERGLGLADESGYGAEVARTHEALEQRGLLARMKDAVTALLF